MASQLVAIEIKSSLVAVKYELPTRESIIFLKETSATASASPIPFAKELNESKDTFGAEEARMKLSN